ncbi:MAG: hypothetical protein IPM82_20905 [Saprospiraceae bacterium]|nr:hypothetical protein [Saprospiraceae bacterium]
MAFFNDLKKLLFGAKAVTKSAAEKAVDATKEASSDLWDKVQDTAADLGKTVAEKADLAMDKAADLAEAAKEKVSDFVNDTPAPAEKPDTDDVMEAIIAEREAAAAPAATEPEETLELPPLKVATDAPKLLDDGDPTNDQAYEPDFLDSLKSTATTTGAAVMDKGGEALHKAGDFASEVGKKVMDRGSKLTEKFGETAENVGEAIFEKGGAAMEKAGDFASKVGEKVMETGGKLTEKFGETAENVGEAIFEKGGEALDRAKDMAAGLGSKIMQAKDDLMAKAQAEAEKSGETTSSLIDKAKELNQKLEDKISGNNTKFADTPLTTGGSEFEKHDSFWEKADRFAKGDYHMKGEDHLELGELKITEKKDTPSDDKDKKTDDLIDDAIVES